MSVERTLDALSGYQPQPYESPSNEKSYRVRVSVRPPQRAPAPESVRYELQVGHWILAEFHDLYLANAVAGLLDACLPTHAATHSEAISIAIRNMVGLKSLRFVLVEILRNAKTVYQERSEDPLEGNVFECRKIAAVLAEELAALGHSEHS